MQGEFNEDPTGTQILIDMGINFIPGVGQVCDARDITACLKKLVIDRRVNEVMIWVTLLLTAIGCVPYAGDVIKAGCKAIIKGADDAVLKILRKLDADDVQKAFKMLKTKFTSSIDDAIAMVNKWIKEAGNSKYGSKINEVLTGANENLRKASDFVNNKIDEFGERVFGKKPRETLARKNEVYTKALVNLPDDFFSKEKSFTMYPLDEHKKLKPNVIYQAGEFPYLYETDEYGRIIKASADKIQISPRKSVRARRFQPHLWLIQANSNKSNGAKKGTRLRHDSNSPGKIKGEDHSGHIFADLFGGSFFHGSMNAELQAGCCASG